MHMHIYIYACVHTYLHTYLQFGSCFYVDVITSHVHVYLQHGVRASIYRCVERAYMWISVYTHASVVCVCMRICLHGPFPCLIRI